MKGDLAEILTISQINDHLFLSGYAAISRAKLVELGITCVLNMTQERENFHLLNLSDIKCFKFPAQDMESENLSRHFDTCADKIAEIKATGGKTLVHCQVGRSRSATICIVYLMKYEKMTLREAFVFVRSKRKIVDPNTGFWQQMVEYEHKISTKSSVEMVPGPEGFVPDVYEDELNQRSWLEGDDMPKLLIFVAFITFWTIYHALFGDWWSV